MPSFIEYGRSSHSDDGIWAIDTVNPNGWTGTQKYLSVSSSEIVLVQEARVVVGDPTVPAEKAPGFNMVPFPARVTSH